MACHYSSGDLDVAELSVGQLVWVVHLPEQHAKAPHVSGWRELSVVQALGSHPSYWPGQLSRRLVDGVVLGDLTQKTKIGYFTCLTVINHHIASSQVLCMHIKIYVMRTIIFWIFYLP